ncbi:MAG TPA: tetratricopeptide repeat protein [Solirubrobacteraceae bacterium]|nr:tetratricopeptide repeat protein [Solirubrobacteraceae bacterium]
MAELVSGKPCRAGGAHASEYGVDLEVLPAGQPWRYIERHFEQSLRDAVGAALAGVGPRLVMLSGRTKSGKTRAAFQALRWDGLRDAWLVVPRTGASIERLLSPGVLPPSWSPLVIWLDDIEKYASVDASGLHEGVFRNLVLDRPLVILATEGGRGTRSHTHAFADPVAQLRSLAACIDVPVRLTERELSLVQDAYGPDLAKEVGRVGLGRRMVAVNELSGRLVRSNDDCREGVAVVRAAVDWRRAGALRPLSTGQLEELYKHYLPDDLDPSEERFASGLEWARKPLPNTAIALLRKVPQGYEPYDLAVEVAAREWPDVSSPAMERILSLAGPADCFQIAGTAFDAGDTTLALGMLARAERSQDQRLSMVSAFNRGVLLEHEGDLAAAQAAYASADERGSLRGAFNLGQLLRRAGELPAAEAAYRRADQRGSAEGAVNLGFLLEQRGDLAGAERAYRRARSRESPKGARNLQRLLRQRQRQRPAADAGLHAGREDPGYVER